MAVQILAASDAQLATDELTYNKTVCFKTISTDTNEFGTLQKSDNDSKGVYMAYINGTKYYFNGNGVCEENEDIVLYGVTSPSLTITDSSKVTRASGETVSMNTLLPKDYFAIEAMGMLLNNIVNVTSIDDATVYALVTKAYKIAQAMITVGSDARTADEKATDAASSTVEGTTEVSNLSSNTEKLLNNIYAVLNNFGTNFVANNKTPLENVNTALGNIKEAIEQSSGLTYANTPSSTLNTVLGFTATSTGGYNVAQRTLDNVASDIKTKILETSGTNYYWLHTDGITTITGIDTFLTAYGSNIESKIESTILSAVNTKIKDTSSDIYKSIKDIVDAN